MNQAPKTLMAFIVAPLVPVVVFSTILFGPDQFVRNVPLVAFVTYIITLVVALPIYVLMYAKSWLKWWHFALLGSIPALSLDILGFVMSLGIEGGLVTLRQGGLDLVVDGERTFIGYVFETARLGLYALTGTGAGLLFWVIAHRSSGSNKVMQSTR